MEFIPKDLAIKLKEKSFNRPCFGYYINDKLIMNLTSIHLPFGGNVYDTMYSSNGLCENDIADAPTIDQVLEWLREKDIIVYCKPYLTMATKNHIMYEWNVDVFNVDTKETKEDNENVCLTYVDNDFGYVRYSSFDCIADYDDAILASINFIVEHLI
jgi:hypothetical protein